LITLEQAKNYLRIDFDEDDVLVEMCMESAQQYLKDSIENFEAKAVNESFEKKCRLPILMLIQHQYDSRTAIVTSNQKVDFILSSLMLQLKYGYNDLVVIA